MGDSFSFGLCHFCVGVAAGWWMMVCHLGCVTCRLVGDGLSFWLCQVVGDWLSCGLCHFCVGVAAGWWVTVCHLGCVTFVLLWLPVGG